LVRLKCEWKRNHEIVLPRRVAMMIEKMQTRAGHGD